MKVYTSPDLPMVGHIKNILESKGIACIIQGQFSSAAVGEIPAIECWPELWVVDKTQLEEAKIIVKEALDPPTQNLRPWKCRYCQEVIEGQFTACWNCGAERE
ncbi:MAG: DUF2007 domain-containing protein [Proteobacteria bacterium]|nr:DUF2007 domain-containing protein [Pseudomonadota bacterium]MBU1059991.1 DUF2007 domain-containing protein [Pseudomonadota bacterium]